MRVCVKEKLRIGGGTIQLSVTQSIVQPVWSDARPCTVTHKTHWAPQQVGCHRGNNKPLKTGPQFQVLDTACLPLFPIFGQEVWMIEKKQQQQTVFFPPHSCLSKWRTVRESIATSEWVRHPAAVPTGGTAILAWQMKTLSSLWEKGKIHQARRLHLLLLRRVGAEQWYPRFL